ncbi:MAG: hypothetical protein ACE5F1_22585 [Planctomycetota bacterium]
MDIIDYYNEQKWCEKCHDYVRFLMSVDQSYCVNCGSPVRLFSKKDWESFHSVLRQEKEKQGSRRRVNRVRAS